MNYYLDQVEPILRMLAATSAANRFKKTVLQLGLNDDEKGFDLIFNLMYL